MEFLDNIIGRKGKILTGSHAGNFVLVQDDRESTGGYLVLISPDVNFKGQGFDNWVENIEQLKQLFSQFEWQIEWFDA